MKSKKVIIAGAGPVGCVIALYLAREGINVQILEKENDLILDLRASTFHPPTLDMLDELDVTSHLIDQGLITPKFQFRDLNAGLVAEFDLDLIKNYTNHPYRLQCEQFKLTQTIKNMLSEYPHVSFFFNCRATDLSQDNSGVTVYYESRDVKNKITCDYLIGCDGSKSLIRKALQIEFDGFTFPERFLTASVSESIRYIIPDIGHVAYIADPEEWCVLINAPGYWRFLYPIPIDMKSDKAFENEYLQERLKRLIPYDGDYTVCHRTIYDVNQRVARCYRKGRTILAGDSAHVNNPLGGMGMNGGIHDGINLAKKLVEILNNDACSKLLDLYDRQRRSIAIEYIQSHSIRNKKNIEEKDPGIRRIRQIELKKIADNRQKSIEFMLDTSMINGVRKSLSIE